MEPVARGVLVRAERVLVTKSLFVRTRGMSVRAERVLVTRSSFVSARGVSVRAERVLVARSSFVHARGVSVHAEKVLVMRLGPIPIGGRLELIVVRVVDRTYIRESVCIFLWCRDDDK
jgi:hypothetical protein